MTNRFGVETRSASSNRFAVFGRARKMKPIKEITFGDYDLLAKLLGLNERPCIVRRNSAAERLR